jgi:hypothetical protein
MIPRTQQNANKALKVTEGPRLADAIGKHEHNFVERLADLIAFQPPNTFTQLVHLRSLYVLLDL